MVYKHSGLLSSHKKEWDIAICKNRDGPREYHGVDRSRTRLSDFTFPFHFPALEKKMATHSSVLAWRIPGTEEPSGLPSMESHRVRHDWSDLAAAAADDDNLAQLDKMIWSHLDSAVSFTAFFQIFKMGELFFLPILYLKNALIYFCSCTYLETTEYLSHFCRCACLPLKCTTKS